MTGTKITQKITQKHIQAKASTDKLCETKLNQHYSPIKKNQLLEFSPLLESCSDIYVGPISCLIVTILFNVYFSDICLFSAISLIYSRSAKISPVHSNRVLSSLYEYKTCPLTADWLQVCFGTRSDTVVNSVFLSACLRSMPPQLVKCKCKSSV